MKKDGKIYQFVKNNWRSLLYGFAIFAGIFGGIWACSKSTPISVDANRNRITVQLPTTKTK